MGRARSTGRGGSSRRILTGGTSSSSTSTSTATPGRGSAPRTRRGGPDSWRRSSTSGGGPGRPPRGWMDRLPAGRGRTRPRLRARTARPDEELRLAQDDGDGVRPDLVQRRVDVELAPLAGAQARLELVGEGHDVDEVLRVERPFRMPGPGRFLVLGVLRDDVDAEPVAERDDRRPVLRRLVVHAPAGRILDQIQTRGDAHGRSV